MPTLTLTADQRSRGVRQWLTRPEQAQTPTQTQADSDTPGAHARDLWQAKELGTLGFRFTSKLFSGGEPIGAPGIEPGAVRWFPSIRRATGSMCCLMALCKTCAQTTEEGGAWISSLFTRLNGFEIAFERAVGSTIEVIHAPQVHAQRVRRLLDDVLAHDKGARNDVVHAVEQLASPAADEPRTQACPVTKSALDREIEQFIHEHERHWRRGLRLVMRDEYEKWWTFPLGARVYERVTPRGVAWMLVFNDPFVADWAAERLEMRLATGESDASFKLKQLVDGGSNKDAGPTVIEGVWTTAPANTREARKQMGRILLGILYARRRSRRDEGGRLVVPSTMPAELS